LSHEFERIRHPNIELSPDGRPRWRSEFPWFTGRVLPVPARRPPAGRSIDVLHARGSFILNPLVGVPGPPPTTINDSRRDSDSLPICDYGRIDQTLKVNVSETDPAAFLILS